MTRSIPIALAVALASSSCTTMRDSILLGIGTGAAAGAGFGAGVGQAEHNEVRSSFVGALTGAVFGGVIGFLAHKEKVAKESVRTIAGDKSAPPSLTKPVVRRVWVDDKVEGEKLVRGHWLYILEKNSEWRNDSP
ncbi:MAG: hypothetical protein NTV34_14990 [Proteobacteria bacterium]|nr:hypothetical protein [Pseudomonadota bacterium]